MISHPKILTSLFFPFPPTYLCPSRLRDLAREADGSAADCRRWRRRFRFVPLASLYSNRFIEVTCKKKGPQLDHIKKDTHSEQELSQNYLSDQQKKSLAACRQTVGRTLRDLILGNHTGPRNSVLPNRTRGSCFAFSVLLDSWTCWPTWSEKRTETSPGDFQTKEKPMHFVHFTFRCTLLCTILWLDELFLTFRSVNTLTNHCRKVFALHDIIVNSWIFLN